MGCVSTSGEPVDTANGDFYESQTEASMSTFGPGASFTRTYDAEAAQAQATASAPGPLGYGWTHNWATSLSLNDPASVT